jgi:hypothetical protein
MFTIQASLRRVYEVPVSVARLCDFFSHPDSFARNMPIIEYVVPVEDYDVSRWHFKVKVPIISPIEWDFLIRRRVSAETGEIFYSADEDAADFFRCEVYVRENPNGMTDADVSLQMRVVRERASEIHPLAGMVGDQWISRIVHERMDKMATTFVQNGLDEIMRTPERPPMPSPEPMVLLGPPPTDTIQVEPTPSEPSTTDIPAEATAVSPETDEVFAHADQSVERGAL